MTARNSKTSARTNKSPGFSEKQIDMMYNAAYDYFMERSNAMRQIGVYMGGKRDLYAAMGYKPVLTWDDYYNFYERNGVGTRIINAYPDACWRYSPQVVEVKPNKSSQFADDVADLEDRLSIWFYLQKADTLSRIGEWGGLYLGFDDGKSLDQPVKKGSKLLFVQALHQNNMKWGETETDITKSRYGQPKYYTLTPDASTTNLGVGNVHWTRIIHIAEKCLGNNIVGTPALRPVFNNVQNLEMITGAATEGYYRGGFNGLIAEIDKDAEFDEEAKAKFKEDMQGFINGFQKVLAGRGAKYVFPQASLALPTAFAEVQYDVIAAGTETPKRILKGSEEAKVASVQDSDHWNNAVDARRKKYCTPMIVRRLFDRLIAYEIIATPKNNRYNVNWPDMESSDELRTSEVALNRSKAMQSYLSSGAQKNMSFKVFCQYVLMLPPEALAQITDDDINSTSLYDKKTAIKQANPRQTAKV